MEVSAKTKLSIPLKFYRGATPKFTYDEFWTFDEIHPGGDSDYYDYAEDIPGEFNNHIYVQGEKESGVKLLGGCIAVRKDGTVAHKTDMGYGLQWFSAAKLYDK